ncbi:MAG: hypothetical protein LBI48_01705 [Burkholderiaceae bacterium]|nr:hypothetical protein [Burkholderiaceae bacterium]
MNEKELLAATTGQTPAVMPKAGACAKAAATAAFVAALTACGGSGDDCDDTKPPVNPDVPVPQNIEKDYPTNTVVGKNPAVITIDPSKIGLAQLDGVTVNSGAKVACTNTSDGSTIKISAVAQPGIAEEGEDTCVVTGTTPGEAAQPDNVKLNTQIAYDTLAPRWGVDGQGTGMVTLNKSANESSVKVAEVLPVIDASKKITYSVDIPTQARSWLSYNAQSNTLSWNPAGIYSNSPKYASVTVTVTDEVGNPNSSGRIDLTANGSYEEYVPPPTQPPTCPPGYVPDGAGGCI